MQHYVHCLSQSKKKKKAVLLLLCWELVTQLPECSGALLHLKTIRNGLWRKTSVYVFQMLMNVLIFYDSAIYYLLLL